MVVMTTMMMTRQLHLMHIVADQAHDDIYTGT
jgi:hypothetical protein